VRDELPNVQGLQAQWGRRVLHCGYCHGWEVRDKPLAVLARGEDAMAAVATLRTWSTDLLLCTDGPADFGVEQRGLLRAHGVRIVEAPLQRVESTFPNLRLLFDGAGVEERYAIFVRPKLKIWGRIPEMLGCDLIEAGRLRVGSDWQTSVPGVYAAGDIASAARHIVTAVASGAEAGMRLNSDLAREDFGGVWDQPLSAQAVESRASSARSAVPVGVA
jgi:thioredoxin reductase